MLLPGDPNVAGQNTAYPFRAIGEQQANSNIYSSEYAADPEIAGFYGRNGLVQPDPVNLQQATTNDTRTRNLVGGATIAAPVGAVFLVGAPLAATVGSAGAFATAGGITGGGMDAAGQYAQSGEIRPMQSAFAGTVGAISGPLGASTGFIGNVLLGGAGGSLNTVFNNVYYGEVNSPVFAGAVGGFFGGTGYMVSSLATLGLRQVTPPFVYNNLNPKIPALFQGSPNPSPVVGGAIVGSVLQGGASFIPGQPAIKK